MQLIHSELFEFSKKVQTRVPYKTRFISKEPKLKPKKVSSLSKTNRLITVVSRNGKTASFDFG
jgi:hypothetical protein